VIPSTGSCGCFTGIAVRTPQALYNLPGLSAIAYRVGTQPTFKSSMLANLSLMAQLPRQNTPGALTGLLTREDDDFAIGLLDAWATVADILTFYQERIANENYLRTATELRSVHQLAREIGYELNPGVAAGTVLAFTMDKPIPPPAHEPPQPGTTVLPNATVIPTGTKVQSVPDPGQNPVTFETTAPIAARVTWNELTPVQSKRQLFGSPPTEVVFVGTATNLRPGDGVLVMAGQVPAFGIASTVTSQPDPDPTKPGVTVVELAQVPYGVRTAEPWNNPSDPTLGSEAQALLGQTLSEDRIQALATSGGFQVADLFADLMQGRSAQPQALVFRSRAPVFGHNAPSFASLPPVLTGYQQTFDSSGKSSWVAGPYNNRGDWNTALLLDYWQAQQKLQGAGVFLDNMYPQFAAGSTVILRKREYWAWYAIESAADVSIADFTLSARVSRLTLDSTDWVNVFRINATTVFGGAEWLQLADVPDLTPVTGLTVMLDQFVDGLQVGQRVMVEGASADLPGTRAVETPTLLAIDHVLERGGGTQLTLKPALQTNFVRSTVTINANAAPATHGETVQELAGSGDATLPFQTFKLRQPPLTYTAAQTATGGESTLALWVNDVRWHEVPSLIDSGPKDCVYVVRLDDSQVPIIEGGDGTTGARFPTGPENIRAVYRKGTGLAGEVRAGQLTLLSNRPLGVKGVTNPVPAGGAQDPEQLTDARANASVSVLTLGRVVSLLDYQNFARAFGGVGKAVSAWSHLGETRGVVVTVAGANGKVLDPDGQTCVDLAGALQAAGEPYVPIRVVPHQPVPFQLTINIDFDSDHDSAVVQAAAVTALRAAFGFEARAFGQPVATSEVIEVVQAIDGVIAVVVKELYRSGATHGLPPNGFLTASLSTAGGDLETLKGAELLTLDPGPVQVGKF
jgi:hypothetical protein